MSVRTHASCKRVHQQILRLSYITVPEATYPVSWNRRYGPLLDLHVPRTSNPWIRLLAPNEIGFLSEVSKNTWGYDSAERHRFFRQARTRVCLNPAILCSSVVIVWLSRPHLGTFSVKMSRGLFSHVVLQCIVILLNVK